MSEKSSILLKSASLMFAAAAPLHAYLSVQRLFPVFGPKSDTRAAFVLKSVCMQLSGYFLLNSLLIWRWATKGVQDSLDRLMMVLMVSMNTLVGIDFVRRGYWRNPPVPLLLGTSGLIVLSQVLRSEH